MKYLACKNKYLYSKLMYGASQESSLIKTHIKPCIIDESFEPIIKCDNNIGFSNHSKSCWIIALQSIFFFSDSTRNCVQYKLYNDSVESLIQNKLLEDFLPFYLDDKKELMTLLLIDIKAKFDNKITDQIEIEQAKVDNIKYSRGEYETVEFSEFNELSEDLPLSPPKFVREKSFFDEKSYNEHYFELFYNDKNTRNSYYGTDIDTFFMSNIFSTLFLNKLLNIEKIKIGHDIIDFDKIANSIGICIEIKDHMCSFYTCDDIMKCCNNHIIIDYNWIDLFTIYNRLLDKKTKFSIYCSVLESEINGPFIYLEDSENIIYFYGEDKGKLIKKPATYLDEEYVLKLISFDILIYESDINTLITKNIDHFLMYHSNNIDSNNFIRYCEKNNLSSSIIMNNCKFIESLLLINIEETNKIITYIINKTDFDVDNWIYFSVLCNSENLDIIKILLSKQPCIENIQNMLFKSSLSSNLKYFQLLLINGGNLYILNQYQENILSFACQKLTINLEIINFILDNIIDKIQFINNKNIDGNTILHNILLKYNDLKKYSSEIISLNLTKLNFKDIDEYINNMNQIINLIISNGADINLKNNNNDTILHIACSTNDPKIVENLIQYKNLEIDEKALQITTNELILGYLHQYLSSY